MVFFVFRVRSLFWLIVFGCQYQHSWMSEKNHLQKTYYVSSRVRKIPPTPPILILPILILNRFWYRYRYRKWRTWYRTGRHWKAEYAICKLLFRPNGAYTDLKSVVICLLLFFLATSISSLSAVSSGGHILTCWAGPWETRRRVGGVTEQAC